MFLPVPMSAFELDRPEKSCAHYFSGTCRMVFVQELINIPHLDLPFDTSNYEIVFRCGKMWQNVSDESS